MTSNLIVRALHSLSVGMSRHAGQMIFEDYALAFKTATHAYFHPLPHDILIIFQAYFFFSQFDSNLILLNQIKTLISINKLSTFQISDLVQCWISV